MAFDLISTIVQIVVGVIIVAPILWLVGRAMVGGQKAKFTDAIWIIVLGTVIGTLFGALFSGIIALIIQLILWLALVKHFFDCGWLAALAISIIAIIIFAVIAFVLAIVGFALITFI